MSSTPGVDPEVSVVIPTLQRPDLVTRAVRSALAQTIAAIEVIVVIDGPDPLTRQALEDLGDPRVRPIELAERGGAPNARNVGAQQARAPWTALLDDDDEWLPTKLERQLALARQAGVPLPVVVSRLVNRTPRAEFVLPRRVPEAGEPISEYLSRRRGLFHGDGFVQTSTIMAPTELLRRVPFTVGLRRLQEMDWTIRVTSHDGVALLFATEPLVVWHTDEDRPRVSFDLPWKQQLEWLRRTRPLLTRKAYAAIVMSIISAMAAPTRSPKVFALLWREAHRHGRPGLLDYVTFLQVWLLPAKVRQGLRDRLIGRRRGLGTPKASGQDRSAGAATPLGVPAERA